MEVESSSVLRGEGRDVVSDRRLLVSNDWDECPLFVVLVRELHDGSYCSEDVGPKGGGGADTGGCGLPFSGSHGDVLRYCRPPMFK